MQEAAQDSVVSGSLRRVLTKQRKYTRCSVCRADSVLHFAGILGSGGLADAQPDETIPEHLILFVDALSDPGPQSRQMDGLGWRCLAREALPMDRKEPMVREFMTAVQNVTGREPGISDFGSIGDFCYLVTRLKAPAVIFGADGRNYHSKDEYVLLDSVHQTAPMFLSRA